jgi:ABC-type glycerol-3-phosphate transport system substrate-binding protein
MVFKKTIMLIAALTIVTACSNNEATENKGETLEKTQESLQTEEKPAASQENIQQTEETQSQSQEDGNHMEWTSLPEYNKIMEQIDNKDYIFETVTDNPGKRILYIVDENGNKQYKTIFVKNTSRLKIINLNGNGIVFNEVLS